MNSPFDEESEWDEDGGDHSNSNNQLNEDDHDERRETMPSSSATAVSAGGSSSSVSNSIISNSSPTASRQQQQQSLSRVQRLKQHQLKKHHPLPQLQQQHQEQQQSSPKPPPARQVKSPQPQSQSQSQQLQQKQQASLSPAQQQRQHAQQLAQQHQAQQHQQQQRSTTTLHQPHGAPSIGPSPSTVSSTFGGGGSSIGGGMSLGSGLGGGGTSSSHNFPISLESPLPPLVQRGLGDRSNEKRKNAALEIEALIKSLQEAHNFNMVTSVINILSKDFCTSMNSNYRKGGLVGLAATAIGLQQHNSSRFLEALLPPILHCFDDPEARVRYYACESLYNVAKVARQAVLQYFNPIFEGLAKLFADVDVDVKNGAHLLDRLVKDIVIELESPGTTSTGTGGSDSNKTSNFEVVTHFLPLLQNYIRRTNPYIRQLIVGWITLLDSIPDISMLDYLPDFLDGLFNMLSDSNREIRQAADAALSEFLREVTLATVLEFGPMVSILVVQCTSSPERLNRLTAITWLAELVHHPTLSTASTTTTTITMEEKDALLPYYSEILGAILACISDGEREIRLVAERTNDDLRAMVRDTRTRFELSPILTTLTNELLQKEDVPTKMAALGWINMLMEKRLSDMNQFTEHLLPVLLRTLSDPSDAVVLLDLQVLSRISLATSSSTTSEEAQFQLVLNAILNLFAHDRQLLETRGSLVIRKLCVLLNAKSVYIRMAETLCVFEKETAADDVEALKFISTMVQTLNLILLTASELHDLRTMLAGSMLQQNKQQQQAPSLSRNGTTNNNNNRSTTTSASSSFFSNNTVNDNDGASVFCKIFLCWCHNPVATFSLCLLAQAYDLSFSIVKRFATMEDVTVGFLMQIDKLVHLLESPIFVHLRLQLLNVEAPYHAPLLKSIYGILMCLPQGDAFRLLNERLTTVCNLRENLGIGNVELLLDEQQQKQQNGIANNSNSSNLTSTTANNGGDAMNGTTTSTSGGGLGVGPYHHWNRSGGRSSHGAGGVDSMDQLLKRFDAVHKLHRQAKDNAALKLQQQEMLMQQQQQLKQQQQQQKQSSSHHHSSSGSGTGGRPDSVATVMSGTGMRDANHYRHHSYGGGGVGGGAQHQQPQPQSPPHASSSSASRGGGGINNNMQQQQQQQQQTIMSGRHRLSPRLVAQPEGGVVSPIRGGGGGGGGGSGGGGATATANKTRTARHPREFLS